MSLLKRILNALVARQIAKHGSVAALAIGAIASVLGIPLAPQEISAIITGLSVLGYVLSQVKALWAPPPATKAAALALLFLGALAGAPRAHADAVPFSWVYPTQNQDDSPLAPADIKATRLVCDGPTPVDVRIAAPALVYTATLVKGSYVCRAQTIANYECSLESADGEWTMTTDTPSRMLLDGKDTGGTGPTLALVNGVIYAVGTDNAWWTWTAAGGWVTVPQPTMATNQPQIWAPVVAGECAGLFTPDLVFKVSPPHKLRPKAGSLAHQ